MNELEDQIGRLRFLENTTGISIDSPILKWKVVQTNFTTIAAYKLMVTVEKNFAFALYGEADLLYFIGQVIDNTPKPTIRLLIEDLEAMVDIYDL